jgi:hypothetical protein
MKKISSVFGLDPSVPLDQRQTRLLVAVLCGVYALAGAYLVIAGVGLLPEVVLRIQPPDRLSWGFGFIALGILLVVTALGLWRSERWAVVCSAILLTVALIYSGSADIQQHAWLWALAKLILVAPAIAAGHMRIWRATQA